MGRYLLIILNPDDLVLVVTTKIFDSLRHIKTLSKLSSYKFRDTVENSIFHQNGLINYPLGCNRRPTKIKILSNHLLPVFKW